MSVVQIRISKLSRNNSLIRLKERTIGLTDYIGLTGTGFWNEFLSIYQKNKKRKDHYFKLNMAILLK